MGRLERARDRMRRLEGVWKPNERKAVLTDGTTVVFRLPHDWLDAFDAWHEGVPHFLLDAARKAPEDCPEDSLRILWALGEPPPVREEEADA